MKKRLLSALLMISISVGLLSACSGTSSSDSKPVSDESESTEDSESKENSESTTGHKMVVSYNMPEEMVQAQAVLYADELLQERSNGKESLEIHLNATYADYNDSLQAIMQGTLDIAGMESAMDWDTATGVLLSPFLFRDYDHWLKFKESDVYDELLDRMGEAAGVKMLFVSCSGFRYVTANEPYTTPEEMAGIKMRMPTVSPYIDLLPEIFNCSGTPVSANDLYMALSTGVVDAQENTYTDIVSRKLYEVQKYVIKTGHICTPTGLAMSLKAWNSLTAEEQELYEQVFKDAGDYLDQRTIENEEKYEQQLIDEGIEIIEVDKTPFIERSDITLEKYPEFKEYYDRIAAM